MVNLTPRRQRQQWKLSVLALSSRFDGRVVVVAIVNRDPYFQYSLCRVVLMVTVLAPTCGTLFGLSVLALSSRFDGLMAMRFRLVFVVGFQYSLCRVVLMVVASSAAGAGISFLSVLALSSRFDGQGG